MRRASCKLRPQALAFLERRLSSSAGCFSAPPLLGKPATKLVSHPLVGCSAARLVAGSVQARSLVHAASHSESESQRSGEQHAPPSGKKGVIGIRKEDKSPWERRCPITPKHVKALKDQGLSVLVEPSRVRCFSDAEFQAAGAVITPDLSPAQLILGVKEVPVQQLQRDKSYMFFSHTHKAQPYNMPMLDAILDKKITLIDYERIANQEGRLCKFGPYAGFAGMIDALSALGLACIERSFATPFLHISRSMEYRSLESARQDLIQCGDTIRKHGLPPEMSPLTIVITGTGSVSQAAQQILHHLPCQYVKADQLEQLWNRSNVDNKCIYVCVVPIAEAVRPKLDGNRRFDVREYYERPEDFVPTFGDEIAPYTRMIVNGIYWEDKYPRFLTTAEAKRLHKDNRLPLLVHSDITCDPHGSFEFFSKSTTIPHPLYIWHPSDDSTETVETFSGDGVIVLGVDNLPAEFPMESSEHFGDSLMPYIPLVANVDFSTWDIQDLEPLLPKEIFAGIITSRGSLAPNYKYISDLRAARSTASHEAHRRHILILGAGMVSGPVIEHLLLDEKNSVTIADIDILQAEKVLKHYAGPAGSTGRSKGISAAEGRAHSANAISLDISNQEHLDALIRETDLVVSLVPWKMHPQVIRRCIAFQKDVVTASYVSPEMQELHDEARQAGITILNECGLDPGIDIISTLTMLEDIRKRGGIVRSYESYCGALPAPEASRNEIGYKFSWSPRGVLMAVQRPCSFRWNGEKISLDGQHLYHVAQPFDAFPGLRLEYVPNGNSEDYAEVFGFDQNVETLMRATFRYEGFSSAARGFRELKLCDPGIQHPECQSWPEVLGRLVGSDGATNQELEQNVLPEYLSKKLSQTQQDVGQHMQSHLNSGFWHGPTNISKDVSKTMKALKELAMLTNKPVPTGSDTLDSFAGQMVEKLSYDATETDFVLMFHRIVAEYPESMKKMVHESSLAMRGTPGQTSATALTVGKPLAIAAQLLLDGAIHKKGVVRPITHDIYQPMTRALADAGIKMLETEREV